MVEVAEPNAPILSEALVRMEYAPVEYSDLLLANGVYFLNPQLPCVIGGEGAGIVEAIGPPPAWRQGSSGLHLSELGLDLSKRFSELRRRYSEEFPGTKEPVNSKEEICETQQARAGIRGIARFSGM